MKNSSDPSDVELLRRMREGSESAFGALYDRYRRAVYRFAYQMSGSAAIADEVSQEVFLILIRQPERFDPDQGPLQTFLHGVGRNFVLKILERDRRYVSADAEDEARNVPVSDDPDALRVLIDAQDRERLRQGVLSLPPGYREALVLCDLEELGYEEAAARIGCPVGTVRSRLHRARALLAEKLGANQQSKSYSA